MRESETVSGRGPIRSVVVDFDGTICQEDVSDRILLEFVGPLAREVDVEYERGDIGSREGLVRLAPAFRASEDEIVRWALDRFEVDPTFPPFATWAGEVGFDVIVVSDGLGLHIEPMLRAAGVPGLTVLSNYLRTGVAGARFEFDFGHPVCRACGTCKMLAVTGARATGGPVAFVGDGHSDRFGALYSHLVFAKGHLADLCRTEGVPFLKWRTFDDVRAGLVRHFDGPLPMPVDPVRCPGWR